MAKKDRLGSDPLSWIGDNSAPEKPKTRPEKETEKPKVEEKPAPKPPVEHNDKSPDVSSSASKPVPPKPEPQPEKAPAPEAQPEKNFSPEPDKAKARKKTVDTSIQNTSKSLLVKNRDTKADSRSTDVKKNLELEGKYLTFVLADEDYGIEITKVKEIMGLLPITRVPRTLPYIKGVINLRGKIVSVIDMRNKFSMDEIEATQETCIIVVQSKIGDKGIIVDRVSEVLNIFADDIESVPTFGTNIDTDYILGMAKVDDSVKILLDIERILSTEQTVGKKETT